MDDLGKRPYPAEFGTIFGPDSLPLDVDQPEPHIARCWLPWPRGDLLRMGRNGQLAWEWMAAWCPTQLAKIPHGVYWHFRQINEHIREVYGAMVRRLVAAKPEDADPDEREDAAYEQDRATIRAEWIDLGKEADEPIYDPGWIEDIENAVEMQLAEFAGYVMDVVSHRPNLRWPRCTTYWGMGIDGMRDILRRQLAPPQRHLVYCEAKRRTYDQGRHTDPRCRAVAQYPTPSY